MVFTRRDVTDQTPFSCCEPWLSVLLRQRGIVSEEQARRFLTPSLQDLHDPFLLPGMRETVSLLREAIRRGDRILVWGDYDADGICASSILREALEEEGADVEVHLPSRHEEGYGLNTEGIRRKAETCRLLITVDCGISNREEVALAKSLGMTVIVTDHHTLPPQLPKADAVMDPLLGDYPCPFLCGAGVALKICQALQGLPGVEKRLDLAAIATVADVVPLLDENRVLVREGLSRIERTDRPGLRALLNTAAVSPPLRADHLAFRLGPRLNAAGRLEDASLAAELLLTRDAARGEALARRLEDLNARRQSMEREMTASAVSQAESSDDFASSRSLVVCGEGWNAGLIGLTAGRLCEKYYRPTVVLSLQGETAVGSCRSIPGIHIFDMLQRCEDLLVRYGGHAQAAGLTVRADRIGDFRARLDRVIRDSCPEEVFLRRLEYDLEVPFRQWTAESLAELARLEPTGCGNPPPVFLLSGLSVQSMRRVGRDLSHLQLGLLDESNTLLKGIAFSQGEIADRGWSDVDILYQPILNEFRGRVSVEAQISAIKEASHGFHIL